jgi:hypothetical protein
VPLSARHFNGRASSLSARHFNGRATPPTSDSPASMLQRRRLRAADHQEAVLHEPLGPVGQFLDQPGLGTGQAVGSGRKPVRGTLAGRRPGRTAARGRSGRTRRTSRVRSVSHWFDRGPATCSPWSSSRSRWQGRGAPQGAGSCPSRPPGLGKQAKSQWVGEGRSRNSTRSAGRAAADAEVHPCGGRGDHGSRAVHSNRARSVAQVGGGDVEHVTVVRRGRRWRVWSSRSCS